MFNIKIELKETNIWEGDCGRGNLLEANEISRHWLLNTYILDCIDIQGGYTM